MTTYCGQLGRNLDDDEDLYEYPSGELTDDDFSLRQVFKKTSDLKRIQFEFRLISPIEFSLHVTQEFKELTDWVKDCERRLAFRRGGHRYFIFNIKHYFYVHSIIKNWQEDGSITANYNSLDYHMMSVLKKYVIRNDSIITFIQSNKKTKLELIESLDMPNKKTIHAMFRKKMFNDLYDNQLIAFYMAVIRQGKCILADTRGKTLSAITAMTYYRKDWPLIIVCDTGRKTYWANQMYEWDEKFHMNLKITAITSIKEIYTYPDPFHDIMIIDYDTYYEVKDTISFQCIGFKSYIFEDQTRGTSRRRQFQNLSKCRDNLKASKRIIFIWATEFEPNKYKRLFPLLSILDPNTYIDEEFDKFEERYCTFDAKEQSDQDIERRRNEFQIILRSSFLIKNISDEL